MTWRTGSTRDAETAARLTAIERKLQLIMDHLGLADVEPTYPEVTQHLRDGRKIQAIKAYREQTGADLAEAKRAVEAMAEHES